MSRAALRSALAAVALAGALALVPGSLSASGRAVRAAGRAGRAWVRVNQVGYAASDRKLATLMSTVAERGASATVLDQRGQVVLRLSPGRDSGPWNGAYRHLYRLDLTPLRASGRYVVVVSGPVGARSAAFAVEDPAALYSPLVGNALRFFAGQRDGAVVDSSVLGRRPAHLNDRRALVYRPPAYRKGELSGRLVRAGGPEDVSGGWFDAGDYLKFVETASFSDALLSFSALHYPLAGVGARNVEEARFGSDWLLKMSHDGAGPVDYQVGIGDGQGERILGDHDVWRLPERDDHLRGGRSATRYLRGRPVLRAAAAGRPVSPNLAGRLAASFGLCAQLFRASDPPYAERCRLAGERIFDRARTRHVGALVTSTPHGYYPQTAWRGDLALGATELYFASVDAPPGSAARHAPGYYLARAAAWASSAMNSAHAGEDSFNLYELSPLADYELHRAISDGERRRPGSTDNLDVVPGDLTGDLADQLRAGERAARRDRFGLSDVAGIVDSVPHALGFALEARWYDELTHSRRFEGLATAQRDWVLGHNAWGSSFVVGAGSTFPHCLQHQIANLAGSLTGSGALLLGATVDGPNAIAGFRGAGLPDGYRRCPSAGADPFRAFTGQGARYWDNAIAAPSTEPTDDYTALALAAFAQEASGPRR